MKKYVLITKDTPDGDFFISENERDTLLDSLRNGAKSHYFQRRDTVVNITLGASIFPVSEKTILANSREYFQMKIRDARDEEEQKMFIEKAKQMYRDFSLSLENK